MHIPTLKSGDVSATANLPFSFISFSGNLEGVGE